MLSIRRKTEVSLEKEIKVLYLDDQEYQLEFAKIFLEKFDDSIKVENVTSPSEALKRLMVEDFDVVVSDYLMDEMTGIEFAEKLREFSDLPLILYTGYGSEDIAESTFSSGVDDYIKKESGPGHFRVLLNRIRGLAEKRLIENLYKKMVENSKEGIFVLSGDDVVYANRSLMELVGCDDLGCPIIRELGETTSARISKYFSNISEYYGYFLFEFDLKKSGRTTTYEVSVSTFSYFDRPSYICYLRNKAHKTSN
ncbi:response regulator [Candidatus Bathyarchaeota archaeon]|nr:response regulator [Candidatus Bathyarchaeota archaeon]